VGPLVLGRRLPISGAIIVTLILRRFNGSKLNTFTIILRRFNGSRLFSRGWPGWLSEDLSAMAFAGCAASRTESGPLSGHVVRPHRPARPESYGYELCGERHDGTAAATRLVS
jgi:hypothetical protein